MTLFISPNVQSVSESDKLATKSPAFFVKLSVVQLSMRYLTKAALVVIGTKLSTSPLNLGLKVPVHSLDSPVVTCSRV